MNFYNNFHLNQFLYTCYYLNSKNDEVCYIDFTPQPKILLNYEFLSRQHGSPAYWLKNYLRSEQMTFNDFWLIKCSGCITSWSNFVIISMMKNTCILCPCMSEEPYCESINYVSTKVFVDHLMDEHGLDTEFFRLLFASH